jgi:hypothetical protein
MIEQDDPDLSRRGSRARMMPPVTIVPLDVSVIVPTYCEAENLPVQEIK